MFSPTSTAAALHNTLTTLASIGAVLEPLLLLAAAAVLAAAAMPAREKLVRPALALLASLLAAGEGALVWFHLRLWQICQVVDPVSGAMSGSFAVPLWIESEKLYVWALILTVVSLALRRHRGELQPLLASATALLVAGAVLSGHRSYDRSPTSSHSTGHSSTRG